MDYLKTNIRDLPGGKFMGPNEIRDSQANQGRLRSAYEALSRQGMSPQEAMFKATRGLGDDFQIAGVAGRAFRDDAAINLVKKKLEPRNNGRPVLIADAKTPSILPPMGFEEPAKMVESREMAKKYFMS